MKAILKIDKIVNAKSVVNNRAIHLFMGNDANGIQSHEGCAFEQVLLHKKVVLCTAKRKKMKRKKVQCA